MKLLYVNGTCEGGSILSTRELVARLGAHGVESRLISARKETTIAGYSRRRMTNLAVKLGGPEPDNIVEQSSRLWGRRPKKITANEWSSTAVENAARTFLIDWKPEVVVVSSVDRVAWRRIRRDTANAGVKCVLYLREEALLPHLDLTIPPDLVLANSRGLVDSCSALGWEAQLVPSVIDLSACKVTSERTKALLINPTAAYGLERAVELAEACPEIGFVFQESTRLTPDELGVVTSICERFSNIEFREFCTNPADIYRDARVLLAPYTDFLESNRPRSVLEAQWNGIPVIGTSRAGLQDAVGSGGVLLTADASVQQWVHVLSSASSDDEFYSELVELSRVHASREEVAPQSIVTTFISLIKSALK